MKVFYFHPDIKLFFNSLEDMVSAKVSSTIKLLSIEEYHLSMPYSKKIEKNLYELRISSFQNIRIFYTFYEDQIVLLHAINKKTQKLKLKDLSTTRNRLKLLHS
ncbi:MAG: type II toxin-antitoxin system RelE/ParE family toxin [Patescibacteria group bacterium]|nr:type II toxin-antitoxin system RelE/ParE family toxin [Patescibacteria group bacterium]